MVMPRRKDKQIDALLKLPWWVSAAFGVLAFLGLRWGLPAIDGGQQSSPFIRPRFRRPSPLGAPATLLEQVGNVLRAEGRTSWRRITSPFGNRLHITASGMFNARPWRCWAHPNGFTRTPCHCLQASACESSAMMMMRGGQRLNAGQRSLQTRASVTRARDKPKKFTLPTQSKYVFFLKRDCTQARRPTVTLQPNIAGQEIPFRGGVPRKLLSATVWRLRRISPHICDPPRIPKTRTRPCPFTIGSSQGNFVGSDHALRKGQRQTFSLKIGNVPWKKLLGSVSKAGIKRETLVHHRYRIQGAWCNLGK